MPKSIGVPLTNTRQERYCQLRALRRSQRDAYIGAGYKDGTVRGVANGASKLENLAHIQARIAELDELEESAIAIAMADAGVDKAGVMRRLSLNAESAAAAGSHAAVTGSLVAMGKEMGMFKEPEVKGHSDEHIDGLEAADLIAMIKSLATEIGTIRVVDMTPEETREYIIRAAPRVGLRVTEDSEDPDGPQDASGEGIPALH